MRPTVYLGPKGPLLLGPSIGRGGEGEVFALADNSGRALKIYGQPDAAREAKVRAMVEAGLSASCPNVAFPDDLAFRNDGSFAGFTMKLVAGSQPIHELYTPTSRRQVFPGAEWRFLVRAALNTARVFDRVHATGAVVGDINGAGVLVSRHAVVSLIDADSFQWGSVHPCRVGVPEFTPPELQGRSLHDVTRTIDHDGFGLAVLMFELLFLGRHPHAGTPRGRDVPLARAIGQGAFAYSAVRQVNLVPPRGTLLLTDLPLGVRVLFERAFAIGIGPRPRPAEWIEELQRLEAAILPCAANDRHARPRPHGECPWCRIERTSGISPFGTGATVRTASKDRPSVSPVRTIAEGVLRRGRSGSGDRLEPANRNHDSHVRSGDASWTMSDGVQADGGLIRSGFVGHDRLRLERRYVCERDRLNAELDAWRGRVGAWEANRATETLAAELRRYDRIVKRHQVELAEIELRLTVVRIRRELAATSLMTAAIIGVGSRRIGVLSAGGIVTAADLSRPSLEALGKVPERTIVALLLWRDGLAVRLGRQVKIAADQLAAAAAAVRRRQRTEIVSSEKTLDAIAQKLERLLDDVAVKARHWDADLENARLACERATADLKRHGLPVPRPEPTPVDVVTPLRVANATASAPHKRKTRGGCPRCGAPMVKRWPRGGSAPSRPVMGCTRFPGCTGTRPLRKPKP